MLSSSLLKLALVAGIFCGPSPSEIDVAVLVGEIRVPLGVQFHFSEAASALPPPGRLPVDDAHDRGHGVETFCYSSRIPQGVSLLELFDSDFGLHTARISWVETGETTCTQLDSTPTFLVGDQKYSLANEALSAPLGWTSKKDGDTTVFEREWTYTDPSRPHMWDSCFSRGIYIRIKRDENATRSITVQNWEEPGC